MTRTTLTPADQSALWRAVERLERESLVSRLSELSGQPITRVLRSIPKSVSAHIHRAVQAALWQGLETALDKFEFGGLEPSAAGFRVISGVTGGVSGFFGTATLVFELPLTTTLMLRSIAGIALTQGEDLSQASARLACLEVFALAPKSRWQNSSLGAETSYYATRAFLAKAVGEAAQMLAERGLAQRSSPVILEWLTSVGSRFGLVVSEKVAATAIPLVGAIGGAAVNLAFMEHFQNLAQAHFAIRRLERQHGSAEVRRIYEAFGQILRDRAART